MPANLVDPSESRNLPTMPSLGTVNGEERIFSRKCQRPTGGGYTILSGGSYLTEIPDTFTSQVSFPPHGDDIAHLASVVAVIKTAHRKVDRLAQWYTANDETLFSTGL